MINRFSSRRQPLHESFLNERLRNAKSYDRIAGYFSSSILEVAGEALETIEGKIRIVCNSDLDVRDVETAKAAEIAIRKEWCAGIEEKYGESGQPRFAKLYQLLQSGKMEVRVLPSELFGLIHGKAGVIHLVDENGYKYPVAGVEGIRKCPRRVGIVSQGLIVRGGELSKYLLAGNYECVVVDECHRARRRNLKPDGENEPSDPNNLLRFLYEMASRTKSLLLATATPVQLYPIEAYDLLDVLSRGNDHVLGNDFSIHNRLFHAVQPLYPAYRPTYPNFFRNYS